MTNYCLVGVLAVPTTNPFASPAPDCGPIVAPLRFCRDGVEFLYSLFI